MSPSPVPGRQKPLLEFKIHKGRHRHGTTHLPNTTLYGRSEVLSGHTMVCLIEVGPAFSLPKSFLVTSTAHVQPERVTPLITERLCAGSAQTAALPTGPHVLPQSLAPRQPVLRLFTLRIPFFLYSNLWCYFSVYRKGVFLPKTTSFLAYIMCFL